ncbi:MAG TPA: BamA/TamA family outer membrane protein, partial [Acidobacteriota bacterium]|nr:BamA/TamA family outer membrane protein [Acidobacteriota bacterium]
PGTLFADSRLVFEGTDAAEAEKLQKDLRDFYGSREEMITDAAHNFDAFERKITALHVQQGYLTSEASAVALVFEGNRMERRILIHKGPESRIQELVISDGQQFSEDLKKKLHLKEGTIYQPREFMEDQLRIEEFFESRGYRKVQLDAEPQRKGAGPDLILRYNLQTGEIARVASIRISGNRITQSKMVEKRVNLRPGEILNQEKLINAQKNLTDLRIFHQATVRAEESDTPDLYNIIVEVMERRHYELTYGGRYDTDRDAGAEVQLTDLNLFGTGQSLSFYTRVDQRDQLYRVVYHSPTLSGLRWKTLISTSYENGELLLLERERFQGHKFDFNIQRQRELMRSFVFLSNYQFEYLTLAPLESPDIRPVEGLKISRVIGTLLSETRDDPLNATRGGFLAADLQYAAGFLGSDVSYVKNFNQFYRFTKIGNVLLASAIRLGIATDLENRLITERFFAGGSFTIRGFQKDMVGPLTPLGQPLGGEALFILNEEIRFPISGWFGGAAFYDAGNVYESASDFNPFRLRHALGLGLRIKTPFGIGRFDYGFNIARKDSEPLSVLHFSLGQAF